MISKKRSSLKFRGIFRPKSEIQTVFPAENRWSPKKKRSSSQKCHEIRSQSTKITKILLANTNLGLDLHSSSPEPVNFFRAQSSLGGHKQSFGGAWPRNDPRGAGSDLNFCFNHKKILSPPFFISGCASAVSTKLFLQYIRTLSLFLLKI